MVQMMRVHAPENNCYRSLQTDSGRFAPRGFACQAEDKETVGEHRPFSMDFDMTKLPIHMLVQAKLTINRPGDRYEEEADRVAEQVMHMPDPVTFKRPAPSQPPSIQRSCPRCKKAGEGEEDEERLQMKPLSAPARGAAQASPSSVPPIVHEVLHAPGRPLDAATRAFMEPRFGHDFSSVRIHANERSARISDHLRARAFTVHNDIFFGANQFQPEDSAGRSLIAHELTHVIQQARTSPNPTRLGTDLLIQREANPTNPPAATESRFTGPLTDSEWRLLMLWQSLGEVGIEPLTDNPDHNALIVAEAIFCNRSIFSQILEDRPEDPLLCIDPDVTRADPRVRQLVPHVTARGPIINWARVAPDQRMLYIMDLLVNTYQFPLNGAAGLVGNLWSESGLIPSRIEGSRPETPMTSANFAGQSTGFTAEEVMTRNPAAQQGPRRPGIGLAQWTSSNRRAGLFQHIFQGRQQGAAILFNMDAQVDYLVAELQSNYAAVYRTLTGAGVALNDAADDVVYRFEVPRSILDSSGQLLPRNDPAVQAIFAARRANAQRALRVYNAAHQ